MGARFGFSKKILVLVSMMQGVEKDLNSDRLDGMEGRRGICRRSPAAIFAFPDVSRNASLRVGTIRMGWGCAEML